MADQTPPSNGDNSDYLRKRTHQEKQSGDSKIAPGQRSLPPQRGLLRRAKGSAASNDPDANHRILRTPITREEAGRQPQTAPGGSHVLTPPPSPSLQSPPPSPSRRAPIPSPGRGVVNRSGSIPARPAAGRSTSLDATDIRSRQAADRHEKRLLESEEKRKIDAERKRLEEEQAAARQAERERKIKLRELAQQKAEEERIQKQKTLELRKAEAERMRLEKEAEAKRLEEIRLKQEKEEELKRLEEEKVFQEKERHRIFKTIETCRGVLNEKEQHLAQTIADEMVKRNVRWEGYISLHSGIGGAMLG